MSRIIAEHKANLLLQILLKLNVYVAYIWSLLYLLFLIISWRNIGLDVVAAYMLAISIEILRIHVGYYLNLVRRKPNPKCLLWLMLALSLPFMWSLWHLWRFVVRQQQQQKLALCLQIISNMWLLIVVLQLLVALYELWANKRNNTVLPKWARIDKKELKRQRERCAIHMYRFK